MVSDIGIAGHHRRPFKSHRRGKGRPIGDAGIVQDVWGPPEQPQLDSGSIREPIVTVSPLLTKSGAGTVWPAERAPRSATMDELLKAIDSIASQPL